jgi:TonB family protein
MLSTSYRMLMLLFGAFLFGFYHQIGFGQSACVRQASINSIADAGQFFFDRKIQTLLPITLQEIEEIIHLKISNKRTLEITDSKLFDMIKERGIDFELDDITLEKIHSYWPETRTWELLSDWRKHNRPPEAGIHSKSLEIAYGNDLELWANYNDPDGDELGFVWLSDCHCMFHSGENTGQSILLRTQNIRMDSASLNLTVTLFVTDYRGHKRKAAPVSINIFKQLPVSIKMEGDTVLRGKPIQAVADVGEEKIAAVNFSWRIQNEPLIEKDSSLKFDTKNMIVTEAFPIEVSVSATNQQGAKGSASKVIYIYPSIALNISTNVDGIKISVDNAAQEPSLSSRHIQIFLSPDREHLLEFSKEGFYDQKKSLMPLKANSSKDWFIEMMPSKISHSNNEQLLEHLQMAKILFKRGQFNDAIVECNKGLELDPNNQDLSKLKTQVIDASAKNIIPAQAIHKVLADYPDTARQRRISGTVEVQVLIDEKGSVTYSKAVSGPVLLRKAAENAAMKWKFKPASSENKNISYYQTIAFKFNLKSN